MPVQHFQVTIPSHAIHIGEVVAVAESVARTACMSREAGDDMAISVSEAVNNAIIHGNKGDTAKQVHVQFILDETQVEIIVSDQGDGFRPDEVPDPLQPENLRSESGRGIFIVRQLMDSVQYEFTGQGTVVRMVKKLGSPAGTEPKG